MNTKLLEDVCTAILAHPDQFIMESYFDNILEDGTEPGGCGTAGCFAGWILHLTHKRKTLAGTRDSIVGNEAIEAGNLIGVPVRRPRNDYSMHHPLFFIDEWPDEFRVAYESAPVSERAKIAVERIRHFIATGK